MSREPKARPTPKPTQQRFNDVQFVNWSLSAEEKTACKGWLSNVEEYDNALLATIEAGYKITISYDTFRTCFTSSIVPTKDAKSNQGYILTGKGSTPLKASKQAMFIHYQIMGEEWASYSVVSKSEELDD